MALRELSPLEARVLGVLVEKERTVPDAYPLSLNALASGCNQKTSRNPIMTASEAEILTSIDSLRALSLVIESSGGRVMRYAQNVKRVLQVPTESVALLAMLMLRGPQTAAELRANSERICRFSDVSAVEAFLSELAARSSGPLVQELPRQPGARENRWMHCLCGVDQSAAKSTAKAAAEATTGPRAARSPEGVAIDLQEILDEVELLLYAYEAARAEGDIAALDRFYWTSGKARLPVDPPSAPGSLPSGERPASSRRLTTFGRDFASSSLILADGSHEVQAWARLPEGWRIVAAQRGDPLADQESNPLADQGSDPLADQG